MCGGKNIQFFLGDGEREEGGEGEDEEAEGGREGWRDKQVNYKQRDIGED